MTDETISIVYKPLGTIGGIGYYHETLVYTNSSGQQFIATAESSHSPPADDGLIFSAVESAIAAEFGGSSVYGNLTKTIAPVSSFTSAQLNQIFGPPANPFPSQVISTGANLGKQWNEIVRTENDIESAGLRYSLLTQNSNSVTTSALLSAELTPPPNPAGVWTPAAENELLACYQGSGNSVLIESVPNSSGSVSRNEELVTSPNGSTAVSLNALNSDGSQSSDLQQISLHGSVQFTQDTTTQTDGDIAITISGTGDTVNTSDTVGGETVTVSSGNEQIGFSGATIETATVQDNTQATIKGSDGTLTASNDFGGSGVIENTIEWTGGGSQVQMFSDLPTGVAQEDRNYSGADGTGTLLSTVFIVGTSGVNPVSAYNTTSLAESLLGTLGALVVSFQS